MEALEEGESRETVAARFKIGRTTLWEWQQRRKETGDFQSKKLGNGGYNHKIIALPIIVQKGHKKEESTA